jgi:hypothetical protein
MLSQAPSAIDTLQGKLPPFLKWIFAGMGGAAGYAWAQQHGSSVAASCVVAGAAVGFGFLVLVFAGLRLVKLAAVLAVLLVVVNYAVLIPFGYGDHMPGWIATGQRAGAAVLDALLQLAGRWMQGMQ